MTKNAFDSDETLALGVAYENAVAALGAHPRPRFRKERIAKVILDIARQGETDATALYLKCLRQVTPVSSRIRERMSPPAV